MDTKLKKLSLFAFDTFSSSGIAIMVYLIVRGYGANELLSIGLSGFFTSRYKSFLHIRANHYKNIRAKTQCKIGKGKR